MKTDCQIGDARHSLVIRCLIVVLALVTGVTTAHATVSGTRESSFEYDPTTGLLTKEIIEPNDANFRVETEHLYDAFGNTTKVITTGNDMGNSKDIATRQSETTYYGAGSSYPAGQFPRFVNNALGHQEEWVSYDEATGSPTKQKGPNGLESEWEYDALGRVTKEIAPDDSYVTYQYKYCNEVTGNDACPTGIHAAYVIIAESKDSNNNQNAPRSRVYYDSHGREVASDTQSFDGTNGNEYIRARTEYDAKGRTLRESRPHLASDANPLYWTSYAYDSINRVTEVTLPDQSKSTTQYFGLLTIVKNDKDQQTLTSKNMRGEVIGVKQLAPNGGFLTCTLYYYDAFGNLTAIRVLDPDQITGSTDTSFSQTGLNLNVTVFEYDKAGNKVKSYDPDMGIWSYEYNVLGELISQTDAKNQTTTMAYDLLGRPTTRTELTGNIVSTWTYDNGPTGIGKLHTAIRDGHTQTVQYDVLGRPDQITSALTGDVPETYTATYDASRRLNQVEYPSGLEVKYEYNTRGYEHRLRNVATNAVLWEAAEFDHELRLTKEKFGNDVITDRTYKQDQGTLSTIKAGLDNGLGTNTAANSDVADFLYSFDALGNLTSRWDFAQPSHLIEMFSYDHLNRLECYAEAAGIAVCGSAGTQNIKTVTYDATGNILTKTDVGTYQYGYQQGGFGVSRPHAVTMTSMGGMDTHYSYDANGNMISSGTLDGANLDLSNSRIITWTSFNKVKQIYDGTIVDPAARVSSFTYGAERQRVKMISSRGSTFYYAAFGVMSEKLLNSPGGATEIWTDYLYAGGAMVGSHVTTDDPQAGIDRKTSWFILDHLGSVAVITDDAGLVTEQLSYDAWGKRRHPDGQDDGAGALPSTNFTQTAMTRGFTGHEMLDDSGLINMNGRVYDPSLGRFLSADPIIPDLYIAQALNRYTYVMNNPLSYTDPSGHIFGAIFAIFKLVVAKLVAIAPTLLQIANVLANPLAAAIKGGLAILGIKGAAASVLAAGIQIGIQGGNLTDLFTTVALNFAEGWAQEFAGAVGDLYGEVGSLGKEVARAVTHGVVQGGIYEISGREFEAGFLAGGMSSFVGSVGISSDWKDGYGEAVSMIAGAAGSKLGGEKFVDGANTGSAVWVYNHTADHSNGDNLDRVQGVLDVVGLIPVFGNAADLANAAIYTARGDYAGAAMSMGAAVPGAGLAAGGAKIARRLFRGKTRQAAIDAHRKADGSLNCAYCDKVLTEKPGKPNSVTVDHVQAHSKGGPTTVANSKLACKSCNSSKGKKDLGTEWTPPNER